MLAVLYPPGGPSNVVAPPSLPPSSYSPAAVPAPPGRPGEARFGDVVADQFRFAGYSLPLPEGKWRVVASLPSNEVTSEAAHVNTVLGTKDGEEVAHCGEV